MLAHANSVCFSEKLPSCFHSTAPCCVLTTSMQGSSFFTSSPTRAFISVFGHSCPVTEAHLTVALSFLPLCVSLEACLLKPFAHF